ncbi:major capsid protein [Simplicispira sedimenti]|uniref:major capsid protein n=1 Tax=Simplicispira sedimenti TaxID=2919500 RepID=UPI001FA9BC9F|nr:major capsid protein [Acidovorax sp. W1-6]
MKKTLNRGLVAAGALTAAGASQAAAIDVTTVVAEIGAQAAPVAAIGAAVLALIVGIKAFQWVRRALA